MSIYHVLAHVALSMYYSADYPHWRIPCWREQSLFTVLVIGDVKTWTKNTNFDDLANWNGGGIACSNDRKVFPKDMVASIYIQQNDSLQELVSLGMGN